MWEYQGMIVPEPPPGRDTPERAETDHVAGDTALLVRLPEIGPLIATWFDRGPHDGVGAHVTVLVPFLPADQIDEAVIERLTGLLRGFEAFDVRFSRTGRFPTVLYLKPEPEQTFRAMTDAVYGAWPDYPPYQGKYEDSTPHLTVLIDAGADEYDEAQAAVEQLLPLEARAVAVDLLVFDGDRWSLLRRLPLG